MSKAFCLQCGLRVDVAGLIDHRERLIHADCLSKYNEANEIRKSESYTRTPQQEEELSVMRSRGEL